MIAVASWILIVLGIIHVIYGVIRFRPTIAQAVRDGFFGKFGGVDSRRLAFWFVVAGPFVAMGGQVALHATRTGDLELLRMTGYYMLTISVLGVLTMPKSPFWIPLLVSPILLAAGHGRIAL